MWHLKIKYKHTDCIYIDALAKLGLVVQYYTINSYKKNNFVYATALQIVKGKKNNITKYYNFLKKHKRITNIERQDHVFITESKNKRSGYEQVYSSEIFNPNPWILGNKEEILALASWDRKPLERILKGFQKAENTLLAEVIYFKDKRPEDVYLAKVVSELPKQQLKAIMLAQSLGYYYYPRTSSLEEIAKILKISKSTLRENLRKAEEKIIPIIIQE